MNDECVTHGFHLEKRKDFSTKMSRKSNDYGLVIKIRSFY
jgi:hypothetical protein